MNVRLPLSFAHEHRSLRWAVPTVIGVVIVAVAGGVLRPAPPKVHLPSTTAAALVAAVDSQSDTGFSGTVVSHISLGLPDLPSSGSSDSTVSSLLSNSRTLQVWYGGADEQRIALLGTTDETDIFRSGRTVWRWDSADRVADRLVLAHPDDPLPATSSEPALLTPTNMAALALKSLRPTTRITVSPGSEVADRATYDLLLRPRSSSSLVASVHIAIDGQTKLPLGVEVYARGSSEPAISVSYTSIRFANPSATNFRFTPPAGATVHEVHAGRLGDTDAFDPARLSLTGNTWDAVIGYRTGHPAAVDKLVAKLDLGRVLTPVSGPWGKGLILVTSLVCVLVTDDGRVYAGAVEPSVLYAAAARS